MLGDGIAFSVMVGAGESYLAPFALALGFGDVTAGMIATAPMLVGALLQLVTPLAVRWLDSHKRWVVLCAALQSVSFLPLVAGALSGGMSASLLYLTVSIYWGLGMATGPAWNTWAGRLVPVALRARYFARRSRWSQVALLLGLAAGGVILQEGARRDEPLASYALVFCLAFVARAASATFLARQSEARPVELGDTRISPRAIRRHLRSGGHGKLLGFLLLFQSGVWIAAPYFTPYMLGPLGLDYLEFTALTGTAFAARILVLPAVGRLATRWGTLRLIRVSSAGIVPLPALWLVSDALPWLFALQVLGGALWAAFELATLLSFFEHIPETARTSLLSAYNLANALAIAAGTGIGALILHHGGGGASAYGLLFLASMGVRLMCLARLRAFPELAAESAQPALRTLGLRPSSGGLQRPVLLGPDSDDAAFGADGALVRGGRQEDV
jgi:MFS family permease